MNLFYDTEALQDLAEIFDYFDLHSETVADRFYVAVEKTVQQLLNFPELGERCRFHRPEAKGMRVWQVSGFSNYLIFYRINGDMLEVKRFLHGARNYAKIFNKKQ